jgi:hypothetical protein
MSQAVCKIGQVETNSKLSIVKETAKLIEDLRFTITIGKNNSQQITSDIDSSIAKVLAAKYRLIKDPAQLEVSVNSGIIGEVDLAFQYSNGATAYVETEKSNKKTIWFDYVKLVTKIGHESNRVGIIICPKNYAHKVGIWNLYRDALSYGAHLDRLSTNESFSRVAVIGYTQFAYLDGKWLAFDSQVIQKLKLI